MIIILNQIEYYEESALHAAAVGRPIRVDLTTLNVKRGRYTRICVQVNLALPVVRKIWINDHLHYVEYESMHLICCVTVMDILTTKGRFHEEQVAAGYTA